MGVPLGESWGPAQVRAAKGVMNPDAEIGLPVVGFLFFFLGPFEI